MENLLLSFNVVAPLILYMAIGMLLRKTGVISQSTVRQISQLVFYVAIPALCCDNLRKLDFRSLSTQSFLIGVIITILALFFLTWLIVPRFVRENPRRSVMIHGIFRSNDGVFGLAVAETLMGVANMGLMVICIAITIPLYNLLAVLLMEYYRETSLTCLSCLKRYL